MANEDVAELPTCCSLVLISSFLGDVLQSYNSERGLRIDRPVDKRELIAWLSQRAVEGDTADGLSVLEYEITRLRSDVREHVLENGRLNVCRLRLWAITHGAHELSLDEELLGDTIEYALKLS